jgi:hypothetical protein
VRLIKGSKPDKKLRGLGQIISGSSYNLWEGETVCAAGRPVLTLELMQAVHTKMHVAWCSEMGCRHLRIVEQSQ